MPSPKTMLLVVLVFFTSLTQAQARELKGTKKGTGPINLYHGHQSIKIWKRLLPRVAVEHPVVDRFAQVMGLDIG